MANPNPNMSGLTPFKPGTKANPSGKSSVQRKLEIANAERATRLRGMMLQALEAKLNGLAATGDDAAALAITGDALRLLKDSEDRGLGTPVQSVEHTGADKGAIKHEIGADAAFAELASLLGGAFTATPGSDSEADSVAEDGAA